MSKVVLCRELTVTIVSATNVEEVRKHRKSKLFTKVRVSNMEFNTKTDKNNETNPLWNTSFKFTIPVDYIHAPNSALNLEIEICLDSILHHNKMVGSAKQNIHKLFLDGSNNMKLVLMTSITSPLVTKSGVQKGEVGLQYLFGEEKNIKKLCFAKKVVNFGTSVAVSAAIMSTTGIHIPTPIRVFQAQEIVRFSSSSTTGESIANIAEFIVENVQNLVS